MPTYNPVTGEETTKLEKKNLRVCVTLPSIRRSEHRDDVSILLKVLGAALADPLRLVPGWSGTRRARDGGRTKAAASLR